MRKKPFNSKRCPRCGTKNDYTQQRCTECGLIFSRVENGSNQLAKDLIMTGQKDMVIKAPMFPKDVSKKKFMFLCGFLGFFGAHNFYVGRFIKAIYQLVVGVFSVLATMLSGISPFFDNATTFLFVFVAVDAFMWIFDLIDGALNKYRIPVAVDFTDGKLSEMVKNAKNKPKKQKKLKKTEENNEKTENNEILDPKDVPPKPPIIKTEEGEKDAVDSKQEQG